MGEDPNPSECVWVKEILSVEGMREQEKERRRKEEGRRKEEKKCSLGAR